MAGSDIITSFLQLVGKEELRFSKKDLMHICWLEDGGDMW